jgi:protein-tyrosine kinase
MKNRFPFLERFQGNGAGSGRGSKNLFEVGEGDSIFLEHFKVLRSKFEYKAEMLGWKVVGITSTIAGEGKTLSCLRIGEGLASTKRKKVLLVDADIRKADLSRGMQLPLHPGLTEYLLGQAAWKDIVRGSGFPGLDAIPAGMSISNSSDLLAGERIRTFLDEVRKRYDIALIDTPPVLPVADTMALREQLDGFLFIYRAGFTPMPMFQQAIDEIGHNKIMGAVMNGVEPKSVKHYSYYYGRYYTGSPAKDEGARD